MNHEHGIKPIDDLKDIPANLSDEERMEFLMKHGVSEKFLESAEEAPEDERPHPRTRPINVRFDDFTLKRLKDLAVSRNVGYQTLLKGFVVERLYEEEKRKGLFAVDKVRNSPSASMPESEASKPRDWQAEAFEFVKENRELLDDPDLDSITLSRLAGNSTTRLLELSGEIKKGSAKKGYPATQLRRLMKGYEKLKKFSEEALELYEERFGEPGDNIKEVEKLQKEAESNVVPLRHRA